MKLFAISDIHGALQPIDAAAHLIRQADGVIIAGDITRTKTRAEAADVLACLEQYSTSILAVHGNWDRLEVFDLLEEKGYSLHGKGKMIDDIGFFGAGGSTPTPMRTATEYAEQDMAQTLETGFEQVSQAAYTVLISHTPPRGVRDRSFLGLRGGSHSVRKFLEKNPVSLCLCGHIHEAVGIESLSNTLVANSGSFKKGRYVTIEIGSGLRAIPGRVQF